MRPPARPRRADEWGLGDLAEAAELIVSELVTNAVRASTAPDGHPRYDGAGMPVVVLRMASDRFKLLIEVWDVIPGAPAAAHPGPDDESGRGLMLVAAQCDRWSWQTVPGWPGKVVWAELHSYPRESEPPGGPDRRPGSGPGRSTSA